MLHTIPLRPKTQSDRVWKKNTPANWRTWKKGLSYSYRYFFAFLLPDHIKYISYAELRKQNDILHTQLQELTTKAIKQYVTG